MAGGGGSSVIPRWQRDVEEPGDLGVQDGMLRVVLVAGH